jgi:hypothetical protein
MTDTGIPCLFGHFGDEILKSMKKRTTMDFKGA